ncbi:MAG: efflux RND transporter periplasmic adaptor subunit [Spirochaetaceae bacterium]|nr:MAG: efflux RND transporter periplasmic adaptor subunit [Spirochaetaceae bacterium]
MKRIELLSLTAVLGLAALILVACSSPNPGSPGSDAGSRRDPVPVRTSVLELQSFSSYLQATGTVKARNRIDIVVEEGGILRRILVDKGQVVAAGSILAVLDNPVLAAGYQQAEAVMKQAELDHNSKKVLFEQNAISQNEYLNAKYSFEAAQAAYALTKARYEKLSISAPIGGRINRRYYDLGAYANPMTPIFELIDNEKLRVEAGVAERFMGTIQLGTQVEITFDAYPDLLVEAEVSYISQSIDPQNRTFDIEVEIPNPEQRLAPEMVADLKIRQRVFESQIVVPVDALIESEQGWHVYVEESGRAHQVRVRKLAVYEDTVLVEGLTAGQRLITVGHQNLSDGDPVVTSQT